MSEMRRRERKASRWGLSIVAGILLVTGWVTTTGTLFGSPRQTDSTSPAAGQAAGQPPASLREKAQKLQAGFEKLQSEGRDVSSLEQFGEQLDPLMQQGRYKEAEAVLDRALQQVDALNAGTAAGQPQQTDAASPPAGRAGQPPASLREKGQKLQAGFDKLQSQGRDVSSLEQIMQNFDPLVQEGKYKEAEAVLDKALQQLDALNAGTTSGQPQQTDTASPAAGQQATARGAVPQSLQEKIARLQTLAQKREQEGVDMQPIAEIANGIGPLMEQQKFSEAEALVDRVLKLLGDPSAPPQQTATARETVPQSSPGASTAGMDAPQNKVGNAPATPQSVERKLQQMYPTLAIGTSAPDFSLVDAQGKRHQLADYKNFPVLMVIFTSNHCPWAQSYEDRIQKIYDEYTPKGVAVVAINPNSNLAIAPSEFGYTDVDDSLQSMAIRQKLRHLTYPWLYDGDTQSVAQKYGPKSTPHVFIFDKDRKLQYEGRIDSNMHLEEVRTSDARAALDALLAGQPVQVQHTPTFGCNTKWAGFIPEMQKPVTEWNAKPINVEDATADVLKNIRANSDGKLLLVTFWSTKCAHCIAEFPGLVQSYTWYDSRGLDMVTVSTDTQKSSKAAVLKFLQGQHSAVRNLQFGSGDVSALQEAFAGKEWDVREPYTVLISPDGKVVYEHTGSEDVLQLRRKILVNISDNGPVHGTAAYWAQSFKLGQEEATAGKGAN